MSWINPKTKEIGNYTVGQKIGEGPRGVVRLAVNKDTGEQAVMKIMTKAQFETDDELRDFKVEIALMKLLEHPHLVKVLDAFESEHFVCLVVEFVGRGTIWEFLNCRNARMDADDAMSLFRQMFYAYDFLRASGVPVLRCLDAPNVLIDDFGCLKLSDFTFPESRSNSLATSEYGQPHMRPPEVLRGAGYNGSIASIWSAGVLLYGLVVGELPFDGPGLRDVLVNIMNGRYSIPDHVPEMIRDLICGMIEVDVEKRLTIRQVMSHPAFMIGLPEGYRLPVPFAIGDDEKDFDVRTIDCSMISILRSIGYESDDEVYGALLSTGRSAAKTFYHVYRFLNACNTCSGVSIEDLPWAASERNMDQEDDEKSERELLTHDGLTNSFVWKVDHRIKSMDASVTRLSLPTLGGNEREDDTRRFLFSGISKSVEEVMCGLQCMLDAKGIDWLHPNDMELLIRIGIGSSDKRTFERIVAFHESGGKIGLIIRLLKGDIEELHRMIDSVKSLIASLLK